MSGWVRVATHIRKNAYGYEVRMPDGKPGRFALDTDIVAMQKWRRKELAAREQVEPREKSGRAVATFDAGVLRFVAQLSPTAASFGSKRSHLRAWLPALNLHGVPFAKLDPETITSEDIRLAVVAMEQPATVRRVAVAGFAQGKRTVKPHVRLAPATSGAAASPLTIRHRLDMLEDYFDVMHPELPNPVAKIKRPARPEPDPVGVPVDIVRDVLLTLAKGDPVVYARFAVLASTGQRPVQLMRCQPQRDLTIFRDGPNEDGTAGFWRTRGTRLKPSTTVPLNSEMVAAFELVAEANAWGEYDTSDQAKAVHAAGWPADVRPYNTRHSLLQDALNEYGLDLVELLVITGHKRIDTLRRNYARLAPAQQQRVVRTLEGRLGALPQLRKVQ